MYIAGSIMYHGANLRGTRSYWKQQSSELLQMFRQLGCTTIFFPLSAADYHWPDMFRILDSSWEPQDLSESDRKSLMHENTATLAWFFNIRVELFFKKFLIKIFSIEDFWYRFEWEYRGSPHVHGIFWLEGASDCSDIGASTQSQKQSIVKYLDGLISATMNNRYDIFRPRDNSCRKRLMDLSENDRVTDLHKILSLFQRHNKFITQVWRGNIDFTHIEGCGPQSHR